MKTLLRVVWIICAVILLVSALAFAVIEGRLLFSGDWLIHEMPMIDFLQYFCRFTLAVITVILCVSVIKKRT